MSTTTFPLLLLLLCIISISVPTLTAAAAAPAPTPTAALAGNARTTGADAIHQLCNTTQYFDLCAKSLSAEHTSHGADAHGLAAIALRLASESASTTASYISGLLEGGVGDSSLEQCLSDCAESYSDATDQLDDSTAAIDRNGYSDVKTWVSAAMTDADTCESSCRAVNKLKVAELLKRNDNFSKMCSIAISITSTLS